MSLNEPTTEERHMTTFEQGQRVYLDDGAEADFFALVADRFAVYPIRYDDEGDEYQSDLIVVPRVFAFPPRAKYEASIKTLREAECEIAARVAKLREDAAVVERGKDAVASAMNRHEGMRRIAMVLDGQATHVVAPDDGVLRIYDAKNWRAVLTCEIKKDWRGFVFRDWNLNQRPAVACSSQDDAREQAGKWLAADFERIRRESYPYQVEALIKSYKSVGLPVPQAVTDRLAEMVRAQIEAAAKKAEHDAATARERLAALK